MAHGCIISSEMNRLDKMSAIHPPLKKKTYLQKSFQLPAASFAVVWSRCEMDYYILELRHSVYFLHVNSSAPAWWGETWRQVNRTDREDVVHVQWVFACPSLEMLVLWDKCSRTNGGGWEMCMNKREEWQRKRRKRSGQKGELAYWENIKRLSWGSPLAGQVLLICHFHWEQEEIKPHPYHCSFTFSDRSTYHGICRLLRCTIMSIYTLLLLKSSMSHFRPWERLNTQIIYFVCPDFCSKRDSFDTIYSAWNLVCSSSVESKISSLAECPICWILAVKLQKSTIKLM